MTSLNCSDNSKGSHLKFRHAALLGTTALVCLSVVEPVFADTFDVTVGSDETNGGYTINGSDTLNVNALIKTVDKNAGIEISGSENIVNINSGGGEVSVTGPNVNGILNGGSNSTITVKSGTMITVDGGAGTNQFVHGIRNTDANNTTIIGGTIDVTGFQARGVKGWQKTQKLTEVLSTGVINVSGKGAVGIYVQSGNTTKVAGSITTAGDASPKNSSHAIFNEGNTNTTTVSGNLTTQGETAYGIYNLGNSNTTTISAGTLDGSNITTSGTGAHGIYNNGQSNETTIETGGSIKTTGLGAEGVFNQGRGNTTNVAGSITTSGDKDTSVDDVNAPSDGIRNTGGNTTNVSGTVTTTGVGARGIYNAGGSNTTTISGSIKTEGKSARGIVNNGTNNVTIITETGSIKTADINSIGFRQTDTNNQPAVANNQLTVAGSISTKGKNAHGISNETNYNITAVSGSISTEGETAYGIYNFGDSNTTTVSVGTLVGSNITTSGAGAHGIYNEGQSNVTTISVGGSIATTGIGASGIANSGNSNKTDVAGSITTQGETAYGIYNLGNSNTTTVSGSIITGSDVATSSKHGIYNLGDNNITILAPGGSITTTGVNTGGIFQAGDNNTAGVFGTVNSSGTGSAALYNASGTGNTFVLNETAVIIGSISAGNAASNNTLALSEDADFELTIGGAPNEGELGQGTGPGQWTLTVVDEQGLRASTQSSDRQKVEFVAVDLSNCAAGSTICYEAVYEEPEAEDQIDEIANIDNGALIDSLSPGGSGGGSGGGSSASGGAGSDKSSGAGAKGNVQTRSNTVWANVYGIKTTGDETESRAEMKSRTAGFTIGVPVRTNNDLEWDVVFNLSNSRNDLGSTGDQELKVQSYNFGAIFYDLVPSSNWTVDAFGFIGYNDYNQERDIRDNKEADGIDTRKYSYSGNEILLGFDAQYYKPFNETLDLKFGVNGFLSHEKISSYSTGEYYKWDARNMTQGSIGVSTGVEHRKGALMAYADIGADYVTLLSGKTADYSFNGQSRSFTASDTDDVYGKVNVGFEYNQSENVIIDGKLSGFSSTGGISGYAATLGIEVNF